MITYPIHEMFYTMQGEGSYMGLPAFFVRSFGCPVRCDFCDSAGTWHPDWVPQEIPRLTPEQILSAVVESGARCIVITGGEPAIYDWTPLFEACDFEAAPEIHLETSGGFPIKGDTLRFNWVVVSPKRLKKPCAETVSQANEFKLIIERPEDIEELTALLTATGKFALDMNVDARQIWLHPEWSQRTNTAVLGAIVEAVKKGRGRYRAGWQIHKLYSADAMDDRSRDPVPLGGMIEKGC